MRISIFDYFGVPFRKFELLFLLQQNNFGLSFKNFGLAFQNFEGSFAFTAPEMEHTCAEVHERGNQSRLKPMVPVKHIPPSKIFPTLE